MYTCTSLNKKNSEGKSEATKNPSLSRIVFNSWRNLPLRCDTLAVQDVDMVIEAVPEIMDLKKPLVKRVIFEGEQLDLSALIIDFIIQKERISWK